MSKPLVYVLNGPNLNLLGQREPALYGKASLAELDALCEEQAQALGLKVICRQSNHEGDLIDWVHEARESASGVLINAGGYSHTSVALLDALRALEKPVIEVHLSNIFQRESYRHVSLVSLAAQGVIAGLGLIGYQAGLIALAAQIDDKTGTSKKRGKAA